MIVGTVFSHLYTLYWHCYYHVIPDADADELDIQVARYKPESLENLCKNTKFSKKELQIMYRGFKQVSESGVRWNCMNLLPLKGFGIYHWVTIDIDT